MSLINQMLKELDARRSDVSGPDSYGQQVRVVPERRRIHPAWFAAAATTLLLVLVILWVVLRPVSLQQVERPVSQLPLKLEVDLGNISTSASETTAGQASFTDTSAQPERKDVPMPSPAMPDITPAPPSSPSPAPVQEAPVSARLVVPTQERGRNPLPDAVAEPVVPNVVPSARMLASPRIKEAAPASAPVLNKQIQEPTPQRRAENEYRNAVQAMQSNKIAEAVTGFEAALQLNANHVGARYALIGALIDSKRQEDALVKAREGLALDPAQPGLSMILARLQLDKGELRSAIETLERTLPYAADQADYQAFLAALKQRDERHKQAIEHYFAALRKSPENGVWWMGLGISLQAERRLSEAQEAFRRAKASNNLSNELVAFVDSRLAQLQR